MTCSAEVGIPWVEVIRRAIHSRSLRSPGVSAYCRIRCPSRATAVATASANAVVGNRSSRGRPPARLRTPSVAAALRISRINDGLIVCMRLSLLYPLYDESGIRIRHSFSSTGGHTTQRQTIGVHRHVHSHPHRHAYPDANGVSHQSSTRRPPFTGYSPDARVPGASACGRARPRIRSGSRRSR